MLVSDVMEIFEDRSAERLSSADIVQALNAMEDRPWPEWRRGKPMTQNSMSKLLKPFGIAPKKMRFHNDTARGYEKAEILDACRRYGPAAVHATARSIGLQSGTPEHRSHNNGLVEEQSGTRRSDVPVSNAPNPLEDHVCSGVPLQDAQDSEEWEL